MYKGITKEAPSLLFFFTLNPLNMRRKRSQIQHWEMHEHNPVTHVKAKVQLKQDVACKYFHGNCLKGPKSYAIIGSFYSSTYFLTALMHSFAVLRSCKLD